MRKSHSILQAGALLLVVALIGTGCDFQRLDKGSDRSIDGLISEVASADTPSKAESSIELLLQKTEVGVAYKSGMYDGYQFTGGDIRRLAQAQAAFVESYREDPSSAGSATFASVFEEVMSAQSRMRELEVAFRSDREIDATLEQVLEVLDVSARYAMHDKERPSHSLLLAVSSDPGATSAGVTSITAERHVSPVQRMMFGVWLHKNGRDLERLLAKAKNPNEACPEGTTLIAKFNWSGGAYVFEKPDGNENVVEITNGSTSGGDWTSSQAISAVVLKGGTATKVDPYSDEYEGSFNNSGLVNNGGQTAGISNIKFCGPDEPGDPFDQCLDDCEERYQLCLLGGGECEGGIAVLTLKYLGDSETDVTADRSPHGVDLFDETLSPDEEFTLDGTGLGGPGGHAGTLKTNLYFYVDGEQVDAIHTSCSDPRVKPGFVSDGGLFEVIEVVDKDGTVVGEGAGDPEICEIEYQECVDDCHDQGGGS